MASTLTHIPCFLYGFFFLLLPFCKLHTEKLENSETEIEQYVPDCQTEAVGSYVIYWVDAATQHCRIAFTELDTNLGKNQKYRKY